MAAERIGVQLCGLRNFTEFKECAETLQARNGRRFPLPPPRRFAELTAWRHPCDSVCSLDCGKITRNSSVQALINA